jgi:hypothetical protein
VLTKADDYPIHQTSEPIAYPVGDRNFYDRYFFNGVARDASTFFAGALGVYPGRDVMDAAFAVVHRGVEHSLIASRRLGLERMDTRVGPIAIEVQEPLHRLRLAVEPNEHGVAADLVFESRARPIEEPRFFRRVGPRVMMDLTRLTQHGTYRGWIEVAGERIAVDSSRFWGCRDRSWGIRPLGEREAPGAISPVPQFYWMWAPLNFEDRVVLWDTNEDAEGRPWHLSGMIAPVGGGAVEMRAAEHRIEWKSGTRHARRAELVLHPWQGEAERIELEPLYHFYMLGIGYGHPEWSHGMWKGELALHGERIEVAKVDETQPHYQHIQAICRARWGRREGIGVLEQVVIGPHAPSGFEQILDTAP